MVSVDLRFNPSDPIPLFSCPCHRQRICEGRRFTEKRYHQEHISELPPGIELPGRFGRSRIKRGDIRADETWFNPRSAEIGNASVREEKWLTRHQSRDCVFHSANRAVSMLTAVRSAAARRGIRRHSPPVSDLTYHILPSRLFQDKSAILLGPRKLRVKFFERSLSPVCVIW